MKQQLHICTVARTNVRNSGFNVHLTTCLEDGSMIFELQYKDSLNIKVYVCVAYVHIPHWSGTNSININLTDEGGLLIIDTCIYGAFFLFLLSSLSFFFVPFSSFILQH